MICGEPRSGSNLLCQALASTDLLGRPRDFLNVRGMREKEDPDYPVEPDRQLACILERGCTPNGVYGFKMFGFRFDDLEPLNWADRLPGLSYVHLERRDLLGQAISDWRAVQTGRYRWAAAASAPERYDRRQIERRMAAIAHGQARWRRWFARNGVEPLHLLYEDLARDLQGAAERIAHLVGVQQAVRVDLARIAVRRQADALSVEWRQRFIEESRDLSRLDDEPWPRLRARLQRARRRLLRQVL